MFLYIKAHTLTIVLTTMFGMDWFQAYVYAEVVVKNPISIGCMHATDSKHKLSLTRDLEETFI